MKKTAVTALAAVAVFGAVNASAATLGGVTPDKIGAEDAIVSACDANGVTTAYSSSWDATDKRYEVGSVTVESVADACDGQTLKVTLTDSTGSSLSEGTVAIPTSVAVDHEVTVTSAVSTESVGQVHINIS